MAFDALISSQEFVMAAVLKNPEVLQCIELQDVDFVETLLFPTQSGDQGPAVIRDRSYWY
jgi:hypothetical protein